MSWFSSINSYFDQWHVQKGPKNDLFFNCQTKSKQLSKKELLNVAPALLWLQKQITKYKQRIDQLGLSLEMQKVYLVFVSLLNRTKTRKKKPNVEDDKYTTYIWTIWKSISSDEKGT